MRKFSMTGHFFDQKKISVIWVLILAISIPFCSLAASYNDSRGEGKALVRDILNRTPEENKEIMGLIKIRPPEGDVIEVPVRMSTQVTAGGWQDLYEIQPTAGRPKEVLLIRHRGEQPNEYFFGTGADVSKLRQLSGDERNLYQPLAGSDFYFADLGLEFLHWPSQKIIKKEMRKGRSCRVVESMNPRKSG